MGFFRSLRMEKNKTEKIWNMTLLRILTGFLCLSPFFSRFINKSWKRCFFFSSYFNNCVWRRIALISRKRNFYHFSLYFVYLEMTMYIYIHICVFFKPFQVNFSLNFFFFSKKNLPHIIRMKKSDKTFCFVKRSRLNEIKGNELIYYNLKNCNILPLKWWNRLSG